MHGAIRLPPEAEGQVLQTCVLLRVTGRRLVSFMFVYLGPSPSTTALWAGCIDNPGRSWTVVLNNEKRRSAVRPCPDHQFRSAPSDLTSANAVWRFRACTYYVTIVARA